MNLQKMENGKLVTLTPEEEAAVLAEWNPPLDQARIEKMVVIRIERDRRIGETDWMALRAWEQGMSAGTFAASLTGLYRLTLRDLPDDLEAGKVVEWNEISTPDDLRAYEPEWPTL